MTKIVPSAFNLEIGEIVRFYNESNGITYSAMIHNTSDYGDNGKAWGWNLSGNGPEEFYIVSSEFSDGFVRRSTAKPWSCGKKLRRPDGFDFRMLISPNARKFLIVAGCQRWNSFESMTRHYTGYRANECPRANVSPKRNKALNTWSLNTAEVFKRRLARRRRTLKSA